MPEPAREPVPRRPVQVGGQSRLRLYLSATPEVVPFARAAVTLVCEELEIGNRLTEDIRLAVTEACSNCVIHAYDDSVESPTFLLDARLVQGELRIVVSDRGMGILASEARKAPSTGYGLNMIKQLAASSSATARPGGGTRVVMRFPLAA